MLRMDFSQGSSVTRQRAETASTSRIKPHKRWDDEGVASTVGTIMSLMVFLAFLSMFTSQYIPVWMEENEASHMSTAYGQFASMKQAMDMQILAGTIQGTSPVQMFSPVKLGAAGIPMFASPTPGYLSVFRTDSYSNISLSYKTVTGSLNGTVGHNATWNAGGSISLYVPNRYYTPQELAYEGDALILQQPDGEYMKSMPQFRMTRAEIVNGVQMYHISYTIIDLRGPDSNYIGFGTRGVQTTLKSVTTTTFTNLTDESSISKYPYLFINQTTYFSNAWKNSFDQTVVNAGMDNANYSISVSAPLTDEAIDKFCMVSLRINPNLVSRFTLTVVYFEVSTAEMGAT